jgi:hypothetical protein
MAARNAKSKKRSSGKERRPLKAFTIYICNSLDYDELAETFDRAHIRYQRHRQHFAGWAEDTALLPLIGRKRWILLTTDQHHRTKPLEKYLIHQYKIREFILTEGDWSKSAICNAVMKAKNKMRNLCRYNSGPFMAFISKNGEVRLRSLHGT